MLRVFFFLTKVCIKVSVHPYVKRGEEPQEKVIWLWALMFELTVYLLPTFMSQTANILFVLLVNIVLASTDSSLYM